MSKFLARSCACICYAAHFACIARRGLDQYNNVIRVELAAILRLMRNGLACAGNCLRRPLRHPLPGTSMLGIPMRSSRPPLTLFRPPARHPLSLPRLPGQRPLPGALPSALPCLLEMLLHLGHQLISRALHMVKTRYIVPYCICACSDPSQQCY